jgi:hypothetical protein
MPLGRAREPVGAIKMAKRSKSQPTPSSAPREPSGLRRSEVVHTSLYLPGDVHEALRTAAFHERCKIHDIIMEGIGAALKKRGYPSVDDLKAGRKR